MKNCHSQSQLPNSRLLSPQFEPQVEEISQKTFLEDYTKSFPFLGQSGVEQGLFFILAMLPLTGKMSFMMAVNPTATKMAIHEIDRWTNCSRKC